MPYLVLDLLGHGCTEDRCDEMVRFAPADRVVSCVYCSLRGRLERGCEVDMEGDSL